jgi:amino acid transporter
MVNSVIGSSIFGLPSTLVGLLGNLSPVAVMLAGALMLIIVACYAEVASQFRDSGGPYLYARVAFGRLMGIQMGWMLWLAQVAATAANANLFVVYLAELWPQSREPYVRVVILSILIATITEINRRGVRAGTTASNIFTIAKLVPLLLIIFAGVMYMISGHSNVTQIASNSAAYPWLKSLLLLVFFYGGFETALAPSGETENPQRQVVFALFALFSYVSSFTR